MSSVRASTVLAAGLGCVLSLAVWAGGMTYAVAEGGGSTCPPTEPNCVIVVVGDPGSPGSGGPGSGGGRGNGGGGPVKPDPCKQYPGPLHDLCAKHQAQQCLDLWSEYSGQLSVLDMNKMLTDNSCPAVPIGTIPVKSPGQLATEAADSFRLPNPSGERSPSNSLDFRGHPFTYVGLWTWFWTDAGQWAHCGVRCTATARDGGNYATVTARPVSLTFDPGDGSDPVSCGSPGTPWVNAYGNDKPSLHGGCGYRYSKVTGPGYDHPVTSTQTITWELTWTGSSNTSGTLTNRTTSTTGRLNVLQIQTVVTP